MSPATSPAIYPTPPKLNQQPQPSTASSSHAHPINSTFVEQLYYSLIHSIERLSHRYKFDVITHIDTLGYNVGVRLAQTVIHNIASLNESLDSLERVKYVCKEIWLYSFNKQIDKLQTNYKGIYVLHDFNFKYITHLYPSLSSNALLYTIYPCALIRGVLSTMNMNVTVKADISKWPNILFTLIDIDATAIQSSSNTSTSSIQSTNTSPIKPNNTPLYNNTTATIVNTSLPSVASMHISPPPTSAHNLSQSNSARSNPSITNTDTLSQHSTTSNIARPIATQTIHQEQITPPPPPAAATSSQPHTSPLLNYYQSNATTPSDPKQSQSIDQSNIIQSINNTSNQT